MLKKTLIVFLFIYIFFADIITSIIKLSSLKLLLSIFILILTLIYFTINFKKLPHKRFIFFPVLMILLFVLVWQNIGSINLFYSIIFGYILALDYNFTKKLLLFTFYFQSILILFERISSKYIYNNLVSGVINQQEYDVVKNMNLFDVTGFRPKGLFPGTLIGTSFIIYMVMIFRNNVRVLALLFASSLIINGRLAILISGFTLIFKVFKKYDILILNKLNLKQKQVFYLFPITIFFFVIYIITPDLVWDNYINAFDFNSASNAGRIYSYGQSIFTYISYSPVQKLFGLPGNEIFDIYDRPVASESGLLSMLLDIGFIGFAYYLYHFIVAFRKEDSPVINFNSKYIGLKFVILTTFLSFIQYEHINGNVRGTLFWLIIITIITSKSKFYLESKFHL